MSSSSPDTGVGVQELIDRLKSEGVQEGQQQAEALLAEAKKQAAKIIDAARAEADVIVAEAQKQAQRTENNGKRALQLASRDTSLKLKEQLQHEFRSWVGGLVREQFDDSNFLIQLIKDVTSQAVAAIDHGPRGDDLEPAVKLNLLVADDGDKSVDAFIKGQAAEMLRRGVELKADRTLSQGFRVQIVQDDVEINFSDEAVTAALMRFLAPKFRQRISSLDGEA
ncbi:V-type ATP synthase subunit E [Stieleria maiorica]|uniref:V-type ATP synthase subunit E n=1 Tax=Stieleria maiorica TaxID=2795974 RepID=A0A5B9MJ48_9BACT|nr:hypothetical protein [Stieleria maiorica]QEG01292.1 V-type ATP synthase subunit E [Stieleria maiorica]